jgi:opacity protein-like surface antigen
MSVKSRLLLATGAFAAGLTATPAFAEGAYGGVFIGSISPDDFDINDADELSVDSGVIFGGVLGKRFSDRIRGEIEASYWSADADCTGKCGNVEYDVAALSILGNVWFDFGDSAGFSPYIGAGIGGANVSLESASGDEDAFALAYQGGLGVRFGGDSMTFDIGYRYRVVDADLDDHPLVSEDIDLTGHTFQFGANFPF